MNKNNRIVVVEKEEHFNRLIAENEDRIRRICAYYNTNEQDQHDMYQEVLINIWKSMHSFRGDAKISTWIYRVAVNTSLSYNGRAYRNLKLMVSADSMNLNSLMDEDELQRKLQEEELIETLQNELNLLSVIDKALISLLLEGLSMKEIADVIGITEPNVKVKIHRIKIQLKDKLKGR